MRIEGAQILLASRREYTQAYALRERLQVRTRGAPPPPGDRLEVSTRAPARQADPVSQSPEPETLLPAEEQLKIQILRRLLGIVVRLPANLPAPEGAEAPAVPAEPTPTPANSSAGWGLAYERHETYQESESLTFSVRGIIQTAGGREIKFDVQFAISRTFLAEHHLSVRAGDVQLVDPLVINFSGTLAGLTDRRFAFDLDADGTVEEIPFVTPGSGLLALDRNGDGAINDGLELFGPTTGNAFAELSSLDADGNGWLDEADPLFARLKLWTRDAAGADLLLPLSQVKVGAILLSSVDAAFTYKDQQNRTLAQQQRAGLFVRADGSVGAAQQIDLAI